jgi:lysylphosphatidylglycerol synthetase-like protein (DUF2156 family)
METRQNGHQDRGQHRLTEALLTPHSPNSNLTSNPINRPDVVRARELVLEHGWNSTSFQIVNPGIRRWFTHEDDAVVGYVPAAGVRVVVGGPVCDIGRLRNVIDTFERDARSCGESVCYFAAEKRLESAVAGRSDHSKFLLGAQPSWDPQQCELARGYAASRVRNSFGI